MGKVYAVVLAAGNGRRMGGEVAKQYQILGGKPVICHTLAAFERSVVDEIILVVSTGMEEYSRNEIVEPYSFQKVSAVIAGGAARCDSVYEGMRCISSRLGTQCQMESVKQGTEAGGISSEDEDIVLVHDGARPFATPELIERMTKAAKRQGCAIPAVPVKDTVKLVENGFVEGTPERSSLYAVQTPQAFYFSILWEAFEKYYELPQQKLEMTDDAMLVEYMLGRKIAVEKGEYGNIKLTTPEDMLLARALLKGC